MIVLDTNVVSELMSANASPGVVTWSERLADDACLTAVTVCELLAGVAVMPAGQRRSQLSDGVEGTLSAYARRILPLDGPAARFYAEVVAERRRAGRPVQPFDAQIAAICLSRGAVLATRNTRDFDGLGLELLDPWQADSEA